MRYPNQNLLRYNQRPSYIIHLKWGNFSVLKLVWTYNGLKFIFERFFSSFLESIESWSWKKGEWWQKVASNQLKIGQRVGIGLAVIAIRASNACQNSYGFGAIWSWRILLIEFSILRDLQRNLIFSKIKLCSFFPGQEVTYIKIASVRLKVYL